MEASSNDTRLFNELIDIVIDHLHDDKASLAACSLVSRTWRNSGQFHLLESVTLLGVTSEKGLGLDAFLASVAQSPRIGHYVRELRVHGEGSWFGKYTPTELRALSLGPTHIRALVQLPALRRLFLFDLLWNSHRDGPEGLALIRGPAARRGLQKLVVQHVTSARFQDPGQIHDGIYAQDALDILSFFSAVDTFYFGTPRFEVDGCESPLLAPTDIVPHLRFPLPLHIGSLIADPDALDNARSSLAYDVLDHVCLSDGLHTFRAKIKPGDIGAVSHFVSTRAQSIRHYQLDMSAYIALARLGARETFSSLCLSSCTNLETFELHTPWYPPEHLWQYILVALASLPETVRRIHVCVYLTSTLPDCLADACAGLIAPDLAYMTRFPQLATLEFALRHPHGNDAAYPYRFQKCKRMIEEVVPAELKRGVLKVEPCDCLLTPALEPVCLSVLKPSKPLY
ncbi:hypothetical protein PsYK624_121140 [Phanerochaete sordida]|uniref:F-box domain-containing protein n=1 Tax=Phanerochaete sordida TaxID=48140 RepID=A0A9P3LJ68_9APHY|nr:hypothetical protein PsYK624_121140 [Phanerochaete sordida]